MQYRSEVDGLRTLAIVPIFLFHLGLTKYFAGGYVGVDIFFVISGFLITSIMYDEMCKQQFSFAVFYEKRIRRIMPPLLVMIAVVTIISYVVFIAEYRINYFKSMRYTMGFMSNIFFSREVAYFAEPGITKPLLHTWSLGVEEQFYILFPLILFFIVKIFKNKTLYVVILLFLVSFAANIIMIDTKPDKVFYLLPFRAWELLAGSILAIWHPNVTRGKHILGATGLAVIIASVVYLRDVAFPGFAALLPVSGSFLCILAGSESIASKVLSLKPFIHIGKRSYSIYIWHWPLIVFAKHLQFEFNAITILTIIALAYILSSLSFRYVENPIRKKVFLPNRKKIFTVALLSCIAFIAIAFIYRHFGDAEYMKLKKNVPVINRVNPENPTVILIGDSHALAMRDVYYTFCDEYGKQCAMAAESGIVPLLMGIGPDTSNLRPYLKSKLETGQITDLVMVMRWASWLHGASRYEDEKYGKDERWNGLFNNDKNAMLAALTDTISYAKQYNPTIRIWIQLSVPEMLSNVPEYVIMGNDPTIDYSYYTERQHDITPLLRSLTDHIIDPASMMCDSEHCYGEIDGTVMYVDDDHMSANGVYKIRELYEPIFKQ